MNNKYIYDDKYSRCCDAFKCTMYYIYEEIATAKNNAFFSKNPNKFSCKIYLFDEGNFQGWQYEDMLLDIILELRNKGYIVFAEDLFLTIEGVE